MEPIDLEMALLAVLDGKDSHIHRKVEVEEVDMQNMVVQCYCVNVACFWKQWHRWWNIICSIPRNLL